MNASCIGESDLEKGHFRVVWRDIPLILHMACIICNARTGWRREVLSAANADNCQRDGDLLHLFTGHPHVPRMQMEEMYKVHRAAASNARL